MPPAAPHPVAGEAGAAAWRPIGLAVVLVGLLVGWWPSGPLWASLAGLTVAAAVGLPMAVADRPGLARRLLAVVAVASVLVVGLVAWSRATDDRSPRDRMHDGGVLVTEAAADDIAHGRNPYVRDFAPVLPPEWQEVQGSDGTTVPNPVADHFPYLPAAALVHVPFVVAADALGLDWDTRILGWVAVAAAVVALVRRPEPAWARLGAVAGVGSVFTVLYLAWGTNDAFAAALTVVALALAVRRPGVAGALLAVALSAKPLLLPLVPALAVVEVHRGGVAALRRWWTLPAVLVATSVPFLVADPAAFVDDVVWFSLGRSDVNMPTSGLGLPAVVPSFDGPALAAVTVLGLVVSFGAPVLAARRWPSVWAAAGATGLALVGLLEPARTFQINYLVLVASLAPLGWLAVAEAGSPAAGPESGSGTAT